MKNEYELSYPPVIRFGWGVREALPAVLDRLAPGSSSPVLVVCSRSVALSSPGRALLAVLAGRCAEPFIGVPHDPPLATVEALIAAARRQKAAAVAAIGGGSVIDAAKAAAVLAAAPGSVSEYLHGEREITGPGLPFAALPTTAGTGAEITRNSVLTDPQKRVKKSLRSPFMVPAAALVDPEWTLGLPRDITAASGLDALTQAVESFVSLNAHAASRSLAWEATRLLMRHLPAACADGSDRQAREKVAEGSLLSAMAFSQSGLGAVHGLAHPLGLALDLAHGTTCAVLLPHILRWNRPVCEADFAILAGAAGTTGAAGFIEAVEALCRGLGVPGDFRRWGLSPGHFGTIVATCRSGSMKANPRPMSDRDILDLLTDLA